MNQGGSIAGEQRSLRNNFDCISDLCGEDFDLYINLEQPSEEFLQEIPVSCQEKTNISHFDLAKEDAKISQFLQTQPIITQHRDIYLQETRQDKLKRYLKKKQSRVWKKKISYVCRQKVANHRQRVKGRFTSHKKQLQSQQISKQQILNCPPTPLILKFGHGILECTEP